MHSNFSSKNDVALLKNSAFRELQIFIELIFRFIFQFIIFILRESSKRFLLLSYFSEIFGKSAIISRQDLLFNYILKECLISKDLQIIRKKADSILISVYSSCTAENFKAILWCFRDLEFAECNTWNFPPEYDVMCYYFHMRIFSIAVIN